jgi:hypothetical protein
VAAVAVIGWLGTAALGVALYQSSPRRAAFDLDLVLEAGRRLAAGAPLYGAGAGSGGAALRSVDLFYTSPPPVAQLAGLAAGIPTWLVAIGLALVAVAGILMVTDRMAAGGSTPMRVGAVLATCAVLPFLFPFSVGLLFGNLSVLVPGALGLVLVALMRNETTTLMIAAGVMLAVVGIAKIMPAIVVLWLLARWYGNRMDDSRTAGFVLAITALAGSAIVIASVATAGVDAWSQYLGMLRATAAADLLDPRNLGPAASIASLLGLGEAGARLLQVVVLAVAAVATALAARSIRDPVASLSIAATASLVLLPVTWFHYAAALIPFGVASAMRAATEASARAGALVGLALLMAVISVAVPILVWGAVAATIAAAWVSAPSIGRVMLPAAST